MKRITLIVLATILTLTSPVVAEQEKGDLELQLQGTLTIYTGDADGVDDSGGVGVLVGRFLTERQEVGLSLFTSLIGGDFGGLGGPFWRFNFTTNTDLVPYVGVGTHIPFGDAYEAVDLFATAEVGARWFVESNMSFSLEASTLYDVDASEFSDYINIFFGFSYFWEWK